MKEWLNCFHYGGAGTTLTIGDHAFTKESCVKIGEGSEKFVYKVEGQNWCFFIPNKWSSEAEWNMSIAWEKKLLDQIIALGLKAQEFEIVPLEIKKPGSEPYTIQVLVTKDFESLCKEESLLIYNVKGRSKYTGELPDFAAMQERFKEENFVQGMFKKIINEYALAYTFKLPISIVNHYLDDSEHYCFELPPQESDVPPVARYMFWDVVSDFSGPKLPLIPTLARFKSGLGTLVNQVACAMYPDNISVRKFLAIEAHIQAVINKDDFLNPALEHARKIGADYLSQKLDQGADARNFINLMKSAISTADVDLVARVLRLQPNLAELPENDINVIMETAQDYENEDIIAFLNTNLVVEKAKIDAEGLKSKFLITHDLKFMADKAGYGLFSGYAKTCVHKELSLSELIQHAQGLSKEGTGKRSNALMKQLGWMDENNQVSEEISSILNKIG